MIGAKLRTVRQIQNLSLEKVASQASISAATLSRVENNKQALDVSLLVSLSNVLGQKPADFFVEESDADAQDVSVVVRKLTGLEHEARTKVWNDLAAAARERRSTARKSHVRHLETQIEALL